MNKDKKINNLNNHIKLLENKNKELEDKIKNLEDKIDKLNEENILNKYCLGCNYSLNLLDEYIGQSYMKNIIEDYIEENYREIYELIDYEKIIEDINFEELFKNNHNLFVNYNFSTYCYNLKTQNLTEAKYDAQEFFKEEISKILDENNFNLINQLNKYFKENNNKK